MNEIRSTAWEEQGLYDTYRGCSHEEIRRRHACLIAQMSERHREAIEVVRPVLGDRYIAGKMSDSHWDAPYGLDFLKELVKHVKRPLDPLPRWEGHKMSQAERERSWAPDVANPYWVSENIAVYETLKSIAERLSKTRVHTDGNRMVDAMPLTDDELYGIMGILANEGSRILQRNSALRMVDRKEIK